MIFTKQDPINFNSSTHCYICEKEFKPEDKKGLELWREIKVRDHCHFTGKYHGAAHAHCNLKCRKPLILPVIFHNLQGYDAHLFIKELAKLDGDLSSIPTEEKYI